MNTDINKVLAAVRKAAPKSSVMDKSLSEKIHALKRFRERYGLSLTDGQYREMCKMIKAGKAKVIERQTNRISKMKMTYNNLDVYFCYDHSRHKISTFLKPEWVESKAKEKK